MKRCLVIFAREPYVGKVKTRLKSRLSASQCLNLYKAFLQDTIALARKVKADMKILSFEAKSRNPKYLAKIAPDFWFYKQEGRNLGEKMHQVIKFAAQHGSSKTVIVGSDSPNLPPSYVEKAFKLLARSDAVLGPSSDGGYYLIGLKTPCLRIFEDIKWSAYGVFAETLKRLKKYGKKAAILKRWYDVDVPDDLDRLKRDLQKENSPARCKWTRKFLRI